MKPLENYKVNKITISSKRNTNSSEQNTNPLNNINRPLQYTSKINSSNSQSKNINLNINPNNQKNNNFQNKNLLSPINTTPSAQESNKLNINPQTSMSEREKEEYERTQKYINYLKEHLNSSYYANNEINNKNHILNEKTIILNEEIKNNNILYKKLLKSIENKIKQNNEYKKKYQNFLNKEIKIKSENGSINLNIEENIKELKQNNLILNKENKSKEEIILNLKNTLDILEKNKLSKKNEKENKLKELKEEKDTINKLKLNIEKITKDLYTKNIQLEEKKKSILYLINNKNEEYTENYLDNESNKLLNNEITKLEKVIANQKMLLYKMNENQKEIKNKINEQKMLNKNILTKKKNNTDNKLKALLIEEKIKNKDLIMNLIKSNEEAKELIKVHNQIKNKYEIEINKIKNEIEKIIKKGKKGNEKGTGNDKYNAALEQLLEEQKNLKMFNKEFREKLVIKKAIEDKIEFFEKENNKLKNIINNSKLNTNKNKKNNINNNIENDIDDYENNKNENNVNNNFIQDNHIKIKFDSSLVDKDSSIYTITDNGKLFTYNIIQKKFTTKNTNTIEGWDKFIDIYLSNYEGSLLLNTLDGLYILTGDNFADLYYYSQKNNSITKIISFNNGHKYGGLIITPDKKNIIVLGGCDTKEVEMLNLENNSIEELPNLLSDRINSSYSFIGDNLLYIFFGQKNNTIEFLDLNSDEKEWKNVEFTCNDLENIYGHISIPVNEDEILIVGGKNNHKMLMFNVKDNFLEITDNKIPFLDTVGEYLFDKDKNYNIIMNKVNKEDENDNANGMVQVICMDSKGNVHLSDKDFNYIVLLVDIHEI